MEAAPPAAAREAGARMANAHWSARAAREIAERIVVEGVLVLTEPAHFGNGEEGDVVDMPLLADHAGAGAAARRPLLTGDSIAGALRSYLRRRAFGHRAPLPTAADERALERENSGPAARLLGGVPGDDEGAQSPLIVDDALGRVPERRSDATRPGVEVREGVAIEASTRTAKDRALFDLEAWAAGTRFPLRFELLIAEHEDAPPPAALRQALCAALEGLADGEIPLGARKRRGYGKAEVQAWRLRRYDLTAPDDLLAWIESGDERLSDAHETDDLREALDVAAPLEDRRAWFDVHAAFSLDGSLLIHSGTGVPDGGPDEVHLHALRPDGTVEPVLPGTSLAGALRARALKIAKTLADDPETASALVDEMFGRGPEDDTPGEAGDETPEPRASRVSTRETVIGGDPVTNLVQQRVSIDRFTGGSYPGALFDQQPVFGGEDTRVNVELKHVKPTSGPSDAQPESDAGEQYEAEVGLLLLLLKDLWTGDLPLGSESTVGRGRLRGKEATLTLRENGGEQPWDLDTSSGPPRIEPEAREALNGYVEALNEHLNAEKTP